MFIIIITSYILPEEKLPRDTLIFNLLIVYVCTQIYIIPHTHKSWNFFKQNNSKYSILCS